MFALVDCNNFYASCERLFRPDLRGKPIVVLSNNDGCVIARSAESKALGIRMGVPFFQVRDTLRRYRVHAFSSNYTLYGDLSARVMKVLSELSTELEIYSIDEAFICLRGLPINDWTAYGRRLRDTVWRQTGIPVSVGLAPTKTLAKIANRIAKKRILPLESDNVYALSTLDDIHRALSRISVGDVWGIGHRNARKLNAAGVFTAMDLAQSPPAWVRKLLTITGWSTQQELTGTPHMQLDQGDPPHKSVVFSRAFSTRVTDAQSLHQVIASYASALGVKLRRYGRRAKYLRLFLQGRYPERKSFARGIALTTATSDSRCLISNTRYLLKYLIAGGIHPGGYRKAGIIALELESSEWTQGQLFTAPPNDEIMTVLDRLNLRYGRGTLRIASEAPPTAEWKMRQNLRSPHYTTCWKDIRRIRLK